MFDFGGNHRICHDFAIMICQCPGESHSAETAVIYQRFDRHFRNRQVLWQKADQTGALSGREAAYLDGIAEDTAAVRQQTCNCA